MKILVDTNIILDYLLEANLFSRLQSSFSKKLLAGEGLLPM